MKLPVPSPHFPKYHKKHSRETYGQAATVARSLVSLGFVPKEREEGTRILIWFALETARVAAFAAGTAFGRSLKLKAK